MKRIIVLSTIALLAALTVPALADPYGTVQINETGTSPGLTGVIYTPYTTGGYNLKNGLNVLIGKYRWDVGAASIVQPNPYGMTGAGDIKTWGFCIEMELSDGWQPYSILDVQNAPIDNGPDGGTVGMGQTKADFIRELWTAHIGETDTALGAAAFQAAVWEIVYEDAQAWNVGSYDSTWSDSTFGTTNTTIASKANEWLADILAHDYALTNNIVALSNGTYQDYIVQVPIPAAVLLGMLGLGAAGLKLRKFA